MKQSRVDVAFTQQNVNPPLENVMACPTAIGREREIESLSRVIGQLADGRETTCCDVRGSWHRHVAAGERGSGPGSEPRCTPEAGPIGNSGGSPLPSPGLPRRLR